LSWSRLDLSGLCTDFWAEHGFGASRFDDGDSEGIDGGSDGSFEVSLKLQAELGFGSNRSLMPREEAAMWSAGSSEVSGDGGLGFTGRSGVAGDVQWRRRQLRWVLQLMVVMALRNWVIVNSVKFDDLGIGQRAQA
jgi:hypothetical protein